MKVLKKNYKSIIAFLIGIIVSASTAYLTTTKALTANGYAVDSNNVEYHDNSSLGVTNVQAAIDGTCTKFSNQLTSLKTDIIDTIYPVGSIYISETDSTVTAVQNRFGGTWVAYGSGKTLVGSGTGTDANGTTKTFSISNNSSNLGEYTHTLTVNQLPSHTHTIPSLTVSSWSGSHTHSLTDGTAILTGYGSSTIAVGSGSYGSGLGNISNTTITVSGQKTTESKTTTCDNCSSSSFNVQNPYITVYMYKRTA